jgi:hypothetical protein
MDCLRIPFKHRPGALRAGQLHPAFQYRRGHVRGPAAVPRIPALGYQVRERGQEVLLVVFVEKPSLPPARRRRSDRGTESIPPLRTLDLRLAAAVAASLLAAGLAAYPIFTAGRLAPLLGALAAAGLTCVLLALLARGRFTGAALFTLAIEHAAAEATGHVPRRIGHRLRRRSVADARRDRGGRRRARGRRARRRGPAAAGGAGDHAAGYRRRGGPARPALPAAQSINFMARGQSTGRRDSRPAESGAAGPDSGLPQRSRFTGIGFTVAAMTGDSRSLCSDWRP